jgi:hypothetical protein
MGIGDCYAEKDEREARNLARDRGQLPEAPKCEALEFGWRRCVLHKGHGGLHHSLGGIRWKD